MTSSNVYVGKELEFVVDGTPIAWARAGRRGKVTFTPKKQKTHMTKIKWAAVDAGALAGGIGINSRFWERPVEVEITAYFSPAKSWPKWKREAAFTGRLLHTMKPDADNIVKLIKDALSSIVWRDDSLVVDVIARKRFSHVERTQVVVRPIFCVGNDDA